MPLEPRGTIIPYRHDRIPVGGRMQVPDLHLNTTAFICLEELGASGAINVPRATAFFVIDRSGKSPPHPVWIVTGRHCIQEARASGRPMFVRVNTATTYRDLPTSPDDWHESDDADVAVALWKPQHVAGGTEMPTITSIPLDQFIPSDYRYRGAKDFPIPGPLAEKGQMVKVGHELFFVGLFSQHAGKAKNLPIARFGAIARLPVEPVSVKRSDGSTESIHGYLVEMRSWGGHSGSPVFWYYPAVEVHFFPTPPNAPGQKMGREERRKKGITPQPSHIPISKEFGVIALLGIVSAHFDIPQSAKTSGDVLGSIITPLNAGIAVVTPAHKIIDLLQRSDVIEERLKHAEIAIEEPAATYDVVKNDT